MCVPLPFVLQETVEHMEVDPSRGEPLRINFDVTWRDMPCASE